MQLSISLQNFLNEYKTLFEKSTIFSCELENNKKYGKIFSIVFYIFIRAVQEEKPRPILQTVGSNRSEICLFNFNNQWNFKKLSQNSMVWFTLFILSLIATVELKKTQIGYYVKKLEKV